MAVSWSEREAGLVRRPLVTRVQSLVMGGVEDFDGDELGLPPGLGVLGGEAEAETPGVDGGAVRQALGG